MINQFVMDKGEIDYLPLIPEMPTVTVLMLLLRRYGKQSKGYGETINKSTL